MKIELDLLNNSYDYLNISLHNYKIANEFGNHDDERSNPLNKQRWKIAFVSLIQATELLLKQILFEIHPNLINQDIDSINLDVNKTVSISQSINRINSFSDKKIEDNKIQFIKKCSQLRNEFIHFKAVFVTEEMKKKYAMLYHVYIEIHDKFISTQIAILDDSQKYSMIELSNFTEDMVIFRGWEHTQEEYKQLVEDIRINNQIHFYIDENGVEYKRFRYGYEVEELGQKYLDKLNITDRTPEELLSRTLKYCGACEAIFGEYHLDLCDIEVCPKCYGQINSCDCFPTRSANRFAHHITP